MPFKRKGSPFYQYDLQIGGVRYRGSCGTEDYEEAKAVEAQIRMDVKSGQVNTDRFTLGQAFGTYQHDVISGKSSERTHLSQARAVIGILGSDTPIDKITQADIVQLVTSSRRRVTPATINRWLEHLKRAIEHMGATHAAALPKIDWKRLKQKEPKERIRELSFDEQGRLFHHLREDLHPMAWFALMTGARRETVCTLRWNDIHFDRNRMHLPVKMDKTLIFPMNQEIRELLTNMPRANTPGTRGYVFTYLGTDGSRYPINPTGGYIWVQWRKALSDAEIEDFRFHDLRHTFATRLLRQTGNLKQVSRLLGHESIETTMRYAHVLETDLEDTMNSFSAASPTVSPTLSNNVLKFKD
ncbi:tyrosine-type recombinase/integrase [Maritimibacter dapengensis]|uniref:Site-specific integrase n=1 Tax=Maritimibacter dapengensis TaxID=2836868 RepID=A0ABS6SZV8_9RHOB|nr:site-specific integrase [Maritimibacter dapengensis]MBV7378518.1 site-specific integrase [Maritimibacter dapengensis]